MTLFTKKSLQARSIDLTKVINDRGLTEVEMVEIAEDFFLSLGFKPLEGHFLGKISFCETS
jgi:hypothetical protein